MSTDIVTPLRRRMIEDMNSRKLGTHTQKSHIDSCKRFAAFLKRCPDTATLEDIRLFQLHLAETGMSICTRNRIMTGLRFLFRVTLRRLDLVAEIYHLREPQKVPLVMNPDETKRLLAVTSNLKARVLLSLSYGCGLRAGENGVTFKYKDYRIEGPGRYKTMTLATGEFIRRFLIHVLPKGFHRIRHYGLLASGNRVATIARARQLLAAPSRPKQPETSEAAAADEPHVLPRPCPCCGGRMIIIESFARGCQPTHRLTPTSQEIRIDTS